MALAHGSQLMGTTGKESELMSITATSFSRHCTLPVRKLSAAVPTSQHSCECLWSPIIATPWTVGEDLEGPSNMQRCSTTPDHTLEFTFVSPRLRCSSVFRCRT